MNKLDWLKKRQKGIGGSDVGAILGVNKWKTPFQVYLEKTEEIKEIKAQSEAAYWGNQLEEVVAKEFEKRTGKKVRRDRRHLQHADYPFMVANIDRRVVGENAILECKTANQFWTKEWDNEEIPDSYLLQVQHYLAVTGAEKGYIAVLIGGQKFIWKEIERDEELIDMMIEKEKEFWNLVQNKIPPSLDGSSAAEKYLNEKFAKSEKDSEKPLESEYKKLIDDYFSYKATAQTFEEKAKEIENNIKLALGKSEMGSVDKYQVNWKEVVRKRVDNKILKAEYPEIYEKVCKESISRRFNIKEVI